MLHHFMDAGAGLSAAQVANQVRLRAREAVVKYYEGTLVSDDEVMPVTTRNICLRAQVHPNTSSERRHPIEAFCWQCGAWLQRLPFPVASAAKLSAVPSTKRVSRSCRGGQLQVRQPARLPHSLPVHIPCHVAHHAATPAGNQASATLSDDTDTSTSVGICASRGMRLRARHRRTWHRPATWRRQ